MSARLPDPIVRIDPNEPCSVPPDFAKADRPSLLTAVLRSRNHRVETDPNDMWMEAHHGNIPVSVRFPKPAGDRPWPLHERARIWRALKLFAFFALAGIIAYAHFVAHWL